MFPSIYLVGFGGFAYSAGSGLLTLFGAGRIGCNNPFTPRMLLAVWLPGEGTAVVLHHIACPGLIAAGIEGCSRNSNESISINVRCISGKCDIGQTAAAKERISVNYGHAFRDVDAGQAAAARERTSSNTGYTVREADTSQAAAVIARICINAGYAVRDGILSPKTARYLKQD